MQILAVPARPAAPTLAVVQISEPGGTGSMWGTTAAMEYCSAEDGVWVNCTAQVVRRLEPGSYYVRYKATDKSFTGHEALVVINPYVPAATDAVVYVTGPDVVYNTAGSTATYTISVKDMPPVTGIELEFEVSGDFLRGKEFTSDEFNFFGAGNYDSPIYWRSVDGVNWIGKVSLLRMSGAGASGDMDLLTMTFDVVEGAFGIADVRLRYIQMSYQGSWIFPDIVQDVVTTQFVPGYSRYDVNRDGVVDLNDITYALMYIMTGVGDPEWEEAMHMDFNGDGIIDIEDLILILANYTVPYYS